MAAGKRYKWQGSTVEFVVDYTANSPGGTITGISKANPAVVTASNSLTDGDVVKITGVVGMTEVNDGVFIVVDATGSNFKLARVDSTGYGTYTSGGVFQEADFSNFCELTNYNRQGGSSPEIDATTICSTATEYEVGLPDFGTTAVDYNFAPDTDVQEALEAFHSSGEQLAVRVTLPKSGGIRVIKGFVQQTSEQAGNGGLWKGSATLRNTDQPVDIAA
jgi:Phage tail protein.